MQVQMSVGKSGGMEDIGVSQPIQPIQSPKPQSNGRRSSAKELEGFIKDWVIKDEAQNAVKKKEEEKEKLESIIESVNKSLLPTRTSIHFRLHDKTDAYYVQVVNASSQEVIREIPSEKMLDLRYAIQQYLGLSVDQKI